MASNVSVASPILCASPVEVTSGASGPSPYHTELMAGRDGTSDTPPAIVIPLPGLPVPVSCGVTSATTRPSIPVNWIPVSGIFLAFCILGYL